MAKGKKNRIIPLIAILVIICLLLLTILIIKKVSQRFYNVKAASSTSIAALGDSITNTGITNTSGWVNQYATDINNKLQTSAQIVNLATNNITSQQLLDSVTNNQTYRQQIANAQIITLEIGYNDFFQNRGLYQFGTCGGSDNQDCLRSMVTTFDNNWDSIISQIKTLTANNSNTVIIRSFDIYYSVAGLDQLQASPYNGQFTVLNPYLNQMNSHIAQSASQNGFLVAPVHKAYNGISGTEDPISKGYILPDGVHPSNLGHTIIAGAMTSLGYAAFSPTDLDQDGFTNTVENYIGTDPTKACSLPGNVAAWPPDFNNDGAVGLTTDVALFLKHVGTKVGDPKYDKRFDLDGDGGIGITTDYIILKKYIGKSCTPGT